MHAMANSLAAQGEAMRLLTDPDGFNNDLHRINHVKGWRAIITVHCMAQRSWNLYVEDTDKGPIDVYAVVWTLYSLDRDKYSHELAVMFANAWHLQKTLPSHLHPLAEHSCPPADG